MPDPDNFASDAMVRYVHGAAVIVHSEPLWRCEVTTDQLPRMRLQRGAPVSTVLPSKNRYTLAAFGRVTTREAMRLQLAGIFRITGGRVGGLVSLHLTTIAGTRRKTGPAAGQPRVDTDGCLWCVRDALTEAGVIPDDEVICRDVTARAYRKGAPGLIVELHRWSP